MVLLLFLIRCRILYKGSAPQAADAARYARARKNTTKCETGRRAEKRGPMIWCNSNLDNAKRYLCCAVLCCAVLCCAVLCCALLCACLRFHVLIGRMGVISKKKRENAKYEDEDCHVVWTAGTHVHTDSWYPVLRMIRGTAACTKESTRQHAAWHSAAPQRRAQHTRHRTELSFECMYCSSTYMPGVPVRGTIPRMIPCTRFPSGKCLREWRKNETQTSNV